ncbi:MAG: hypothetical protein QW390_00315 [Candidatus Bathyarchaeia archaeon]
MGERTSAAIRVGNFIRDYYSYMILSTVFLGIVVGKLFPALTRGLTPYMLYLIAVMICAMSVTIRFADLSQTFTKGRLIGCGLATNFIFLPLLCYALAASLMSRYPLYAAGFILMGTVPCAGMNVVWTGLLKGDVALALLLGALTMILGIVTIPVLTGILAGAYVAVDVVGMLRILVVALIIPIILGMSTRKLLERRSGGGVGVYLPVFPPVAAVMAMLLMFIMVSVNIPTLPVAGDVLLILILPSLILFPVAFEGIHVFCNRMLRCAERETVAIVYSSGMKHLPLAMGVAFVSLGQQAALPIAVAAVFQTINAGVFYKRFQRRLHGGSADG